MSVSEIWSCLFIYFGVVPLLFSYNIDTENPVLYRGKQNNSFFGFAAEFFKTAEGYTLYVGAPKEDTNGNKSGVVYKCDVTKDNCSSYRHDYKGHDRKMEGRYPYFEEMYGSAITSYNGTEVMVCAYRWADLRNSDMWYLPGRCHRVKGSTKYQTILLKKAEHKTAESGFSADGSKNGFYVVGGPGLYNWQGGFSVLEGLNFETSTIQNIPKNSYLGYSVAVGNFCLTRQRCFAAGAPLYQNVGMVNFYHYDSFIFNLLYTIKGKENPEKQAFSYFGASLCAADVNGDGHDDILIGAPFYSDERKTDTGKVYIYLNSIKQGEKLNFTRSHTTLTGSSVNNARFGSSISNAGDLNADGFEDVLISAPYEDEGKGVLYLYHGSSSGIVPDFSQRIFGRSFPGVFTFGWYISKSADIDNNSYPDVALGNYLSDTVVVLKTRPIADISGRIVTEPSFIFLNTTCPGGKKGCFIIHVCFSLSGRHLPDSLNVEYNMTLDAKKSDSHRRIQANITNTRNLTLKIGEEKCDKYQAYTIEDKMKRDAFRLIQLVADFSLTQPADPNSDIQPKMNISRGTKIETNIAFITGCKGQCYADLSLKMTLKTSNEEDIIIINKTKNIYLSFVLSNSGEKAFASLIVLSWTGSLLYQTVTSKSQAEDYVSCFEVSNSKNNFRCEVAKPLEQNVSMEFSVTLDTQDISTTQPILTVSAEAETSSNETNISNNKVTASVNVSMVTNVTVNSFAQDDIQLFDSQLESREVKLVHKYIITNKGPSYLPSTSVFVNIPIFRLRKNTVKQTTVKMTFDDDTEEDCTQESESSNNATIETSEVSVTCALFPCRTYKCKKLEMDPGEHVQLSVIIEMSARNFSKDLKLVRYYTKLKIEEPTNQVFVAWHHSVSHKVSTDIYIHKSEVNIWIIVGSAAGGLLLFFILLIVFWRMGFFKRAKKEEINKWKIESGYYKIGSSKKSEETEKTEAMTSLPED